MFRATRTISRATYREAVRHPAYYILTLSAALLIYTSRKFTFFGFSSESNMIREMGIATFVLWGVIASILLAHQSLFVEIENRSAITLLAKPVPRPAYLFGKYLGLLRALALGLLFLTSVLILTLWVHEGLPTLVRVEARAAKSLIHFAADAPEWEFLSPEGPTGVLGGVAPAAAAEALSLAPQELVWKYFHGEFLARNVWTILAGAFLSLGQIALVASCAVALAAYAPPVVVAAGTAAVYLVGHLTDYLSGALLRVGGPAAGLGRILAWMLPNLENFNPSDRLSRGEMVSGIYVALASAYAILYVFAVLGAAGFVFSRREMP